MKSKHNSLAKLAKRLDWRKSKDFIPRVDGYDVSLARRIIEELAKVETASDLVGLIGKCRAIAEEGEAK